VKASKASIGRALDQPDPRMRVFLFHGPDEAQSRGLAQRLLDGLGADKFIVSAASAKSDPAALADEAGAMSLFGGRRAIWIEPAGDEVAAGLEAVLGGPAAESPVIVIAGPLRKSSAILRLAEGSSHALAYASYVPEGKDAERMVIEVGRRFGLKIGSTVAARIADTCMSDQGLAAQELQKLAIYVDASPETPKELDHEAVDAIGTGTSEGEFLRLADLALGGELEALADELSRLSSGGSQAVPVVRALQRRLMMLAPARSRIERGETLDGAMTSLGKALFWKDKALVAKLLTLWDAKGLATVSERAGRLERDLMFSHAPDQQTLGEELLAIARAARRR
jgi:DNA polymerase-3 subunit delta